MESCQKSGGLITFENAIPELEKMLKAQEDFYRHDIQSNEEKISAKLDEIHRRVVQLEANVKAMFERMVEEKDECTSQLRTLVSYQKGMAEKSQQARQSKDLLNMLNAVAKEPQSLLQSQLVTVNLETKEWQAILNINKLLMNHHHQYKIGPSSSNYTQHP